MKLLDIHTLRTDYIFTRFYTEKRSSIYTCEQCIARSRVASTISIWSSTTSVFMNKFVITKQFRIACVFVSFQNYFNLVKFNQFSMCESFYCFCIVINESRKRNFFLWIFEKNGCREYLSIFMWIIIITTQFHWIADRWSFK